MEDAFLGADERLNLGLGIQLHAVPFLIECSHGLAQLGCSHRGLVAVGIGIAGHLTEFVDGTLRGGHVRTADGEAHDVAAFGIELCNFLQFAAEVVFLYE